MQGAQAIIHTKTLFAPQNALLVSIGEQVCHAAADGGAVRQGGRGACFSLSEN